MGEELHYCEKLRMSAVRPGTCAICGSWEQRPEFHHESYRPERGILLCHACHQRAHFRPWQLDTREKEKLLLCRLGAAEYNRLRQDPGVWEREISGYCAPGRRAAQLEVRRQVRASTREQNPAVTMK